MVGTADWSLRQDDELSKLVGDYVVARDDAGREPDEMDFTEGGFTDFDYFLVEDLSPVEIMEIGGNIREASKGRPAWFTFDGVGHRVFFGELEDVKAKVRRFHAALDVVKATLVNQIRDAADEDDRLGRGEFRLISVSDPGPESFTIAVKDNAERIRIFRVQISEQGGS